MTLRHRPDQRLAHGLAGLIQEFQYTGIPGLDGQQEVALLQPDFKMPGAVVPLPREGVLRSLELTDAMRLDPA